MPYQNRAIICYLSWNALLDALTWRRGGFNETYDNLKRGHDAGTQVRG